MQVAARPRSHAPFPAFSANSSLLSTAWWLAASLSGEQAVEAATGVAGHSYKACDSESRWPPLCGPHIAARSMEYRTLVLNGPSKNLQTMSIQISRCRQLPTAYPWRKISTLLLL